MVPGEESKAPHDLDVRLLRFRNRPGSEEAVALARSLLEAGRLSEAVEVASGALAQQPENGTLLLLEGQAWLRQGDFLRAQASLLRAARADPNSKEPFRWLGEVLLKRGDPQRAVEVLERARQLDGSDRVVRDLHNRAQRLARIVQSTQTPVSDFPGKREAKKASVSKDAQTRPDAEPPKGTTLPHPAPVMQSNRTASYTGQRLDAPERAPFRPRRNAAGPTPPLPAGVGRPSKPAPAPEAAPVESKVSKAPPVPPAPPTAPTAVPKVKAKASAPGPTPPPSSETRKVKAPVLPSAPAERAAAKVAPPAPPRPASALAKEEKRQEEATRKVTLPKAQPGPAPKPAAPAVSAETATKVQSPKAEESTSDEKKNKKPAAPAKKSSPKAGAKTLKQGSSDTRPSAKKPVTQPPPPPKAALGRSTTPPAVEEGIVDVPTRVSTLRPFEAAPASDNERVVPGDFEDFSAPSVAMPRAVAPATPPPSKVPPRFDAAPPGVAPLPERAAPLGRWLDDPELALHTREDGSHPLDWHNETNEVVASSSLPPPMPRTLQGYASETPEDHWDSVTFEEVIPDPAALRRARARARKKRSGPGLIRILALLMFTAAMGMGAHWGWNQWLAYQGGEAHRHLVRAYRALLPGTHSDLALAERYLTRARRHQAESGDVHRIRLLIHLQRAIEGGQQKAQGLERAMRLARRRGKEKALVAAGEAWLEAWKSAENKARAALARAQKLGPKDAWVNYAAGRLMQRWGDERAEEHLRLSLAQEAGLGAAQLALMELHLAQGEQEAMRADLQNLLRRYPSHLRALAWKAYVDAPLVDPDQGWKTVADLEREASKGAPVDRFLLQLSKAQLLARRSDEEAARAALTKAEELGMKEPQWRVLLAERAQALEMPALAAQQARALLQATPLQARWRAAAGAWLFGGGDWLGAYAILRDIPPEERTSLPWRASLTLALGFAPHLEALVESFGSSLHEEESPSVDTRALYARLQVLVGKAAEVLEEVRKLNRENSELSARRALVDVALAAGNPDLAQQSASAVLKSEPSRPEGHLFMALYAHGTGRREEADAALAKALESDPKHEESRWLRVAWAIEEGRFDAAADALDAIEGEAPESPWSRLLLRLRRAQLDLAQGRLEPARKTLQGLSPEEREMPQAGLVLAQEALQVGEAARALPLVQAWASAPYPPSELLATHARALFETGEVEAAKAQWLRLQRRDGKSPEALLGLGRVEFHARHFREASKLFESAGSEARERSMPPLFRARLALASAQAHLEQGSRYRREAFESLQKASTIAGAPSEIWLYLGKSAAEARPKVARRAFEHYLELVPQGDGAEEARTGLQGLKKR